MTERGFHVLDYLGVVKRRRWWLMTPLAVSLLIGGLLALLLPSKYLSSTTIGITSPAVSPDLVKASQWDRQERVRAITQQLLSPPLLERVAREERLDENRPIEAAVADLRSRVQVAPAPLPIGRRDPRAGLDSFVLSVSATDPAKAQSLTSRLAQAFIQENSRQREMRAEDTSAFLKQQLDQSQRRLSTLEERLRQAKESYMGRLPEQTNANLAMVTGLRQQLESTATSLRGEQDRLSMIDRQIEAMRQGALDAPLPAGAVALSPRARVRTLERQLKEALTFYTEKHPEIQRLKDELAAARAEAESAKQSTPDVRLAELEANPAYRQLLADRERVNLRMRDLERAEARIRSQIEMYQGRVEQAPMVEQQLVSLQRDYDLERQQYTQLSNRWQAALLAEDLERRRGGEQFAIIYPASLPKEPYAPNRTRILLMAIMAGLGLGVGLTVAREYFDRSVHDARTLQEVFELPVLAEISRVRPNA